MATFSQSREISDEAWHNREFEWTGKSFYFETCMFILGKPIGLDGKLEQLNANLRAAGYKIKNSMVLIEFGKFKGHVMVEVEKKDLYDSQVTTYDVHTNCDTMIHYYSKGNLSKSFGILKERIASRRSREARQLFYMYQPNPEAVKTIIFALT